MDEKTKKRLKELIGDYGDYIREMEDECLATFEIDKIKKELIECDKEINKIIDDA